MSLHASSAGLGIEFQASKDAAYAPSVPDTGSMIRANLASRERLRRTLTGPRAPRRPQPIVVNRALRPPRGSVSTTSSRQGTVTSSRMRSVRGMEGLERAEIGDAMVSFDVAGVNMQEGSRFVVDPMTPGGCTVPSMMRRHSTGQQSRAQNSPIGLPRDVTLLSFGPSHAAGAADLKSLLGDSNARLKAGAVILPDRARHTSDKKARKEQGVALEQAKPRARVEVDIVLESNVCVQGGYVRGHIKIRIRRRSKKESPISLSEGKIRIVGYEMIPYGDERHIFYQCAAPLSSVTDAAHNVYCSGTDEDGFAQGVEGVHVLPFALHLPADSSFGSPKGTLNISSGVIVRYIAMVSIRVKDPDSGKRSIAHFYRDCEVWPVLNPSHVLQSAPRPLQATANKSISLIGGGSAKVKLNAQLHRLCWPAGSRCPISIHVANDSKKTIRSLQLALVRTTTIFRPRPLLDAGEDRDPDSCQTVTAHKAVAESLLEMGAGVAKGHASAKGWWTGVAPGQELEFSHFIILPPDALSVSRGRLLEVEYSIRVTLSAGSFASDIFVTLPIRIFNFISIDPPPSAGLLSSTGAYIRSTQLPTVATMESLDRRATFGKAASTLRTTLPVTMEDEEEPETIVSHASRTSSLRVTNPDIPYQDTTLLSNQRFIPAQSETSIYSASTSSDISCDGDGDIETSSTDLPYASPCPRTTEFEGDVGSDEELEAVLGSVKLQGSQFSLKLAGSSQHPRTKAGPRSKKPSRPAQARGNEETTPRMEGVGSGMRKAHESKLLAARSARKHSPVVEESEYQTTSNSSSASNLHDETTPRVGDAQSHAIHHHRGEHFSSDIGIDSETYSSMSTSSDASRRGMMSGSHRGSRGLPLPLSRVVRGASAGDDAERAAVPPNKPTTSLLRPTHTLTQQKSGSRLLPVPPAIPQPRRAPSPTGRSTYGTDPESLRNKMNSARPPKSPVRPPRSPFRPHGGSIQRPSTSGTESEPAARTNKHMSFRERIAALEHGGNVNGP